MESRPGWKEKTRNISLGYGGEKKTILRALDFVDYDTHSIGSYDTLFIAGFDTRTKWNSLFRVILGNPNKFEELFNQHFMLSSLNGSPALCGATHLMKPLKAKNVSVYLFMLMNDSVYPNLYITTNFIRFEPITHFAPQNQYNWYTTEIIRWPISGKEQGEGVLYKPLNFNPAKKYPVIFYYYENNSHALNWFINPCLSNGTLNVPWYVSNGYLVFVPDISYNGAGYPGRTAYRTVVTAEKYLSKRLYIDSKHIGLQGHSYGGFETNYIVTKSKLFAAAASGAGVAEIISRYGLNQKYYESGQGRIGFTLWEKPNLYIENSPIFNADKINTPMLIMHNKGDGIVGFNQGQEWFNALKRNRKKVWMLSYENENHAIVLEKNQLDYSIRLNQFFDHYLKVLPAPLWMTRSISGDAGFALDSTNLIR